MSDTIDLDAYFKRIGYSGPRTATLDTLRAIHLLQPQAIPFENLDPLLRRPVRLDLPSVQEKLIHSGRGGYCFELNGLLAQALRQLGFRVTPLAGRVVWGAPEGSVRPRTHMLLQVDLDEGPWIADVGFGGATLTGPLRLARDIEQQTPRELFRLIATGDHYSEQILVQGSWRTLYHFNLERQLPPDYEMANWYVSTFPPSHFLHDLSVARVTADGRLALRNSLLSSYPVGGAREQRRLTSVGTLTTVLTEDFQLTLPETPELSEVLARTLARPVES